MFDWANSTYEQRKAHIDGLDRQVREDIARHQKMMKGHEYTQALILTHLSAYQAVQMVSMYAMLNGIFEPSRKRADSHE